MTTSRRTPLPPDPRSADLAADLTALGAAITECRACPRLVAWREEVARTKRPAYAHEDYWGRPAPGFGSERPGVLVVGLAPAAHGANRTGRVFTGDRSGDWLFASMHRVGLANQSTSVSRDDGLELFGTRVLSAVRCAPPENKPSPEERDTCAPWLAAELDLVLPSLRVVVALGAFGWQAALAALSGAGADVPSPRPRFGHGTEVRLPMPGRDDLLLLGCYHPSPHNTATGRLTAPMLDAVLARAAILRG
jgi:uracil-DNA glycosylase family 4